MKFILILIMLSLNVIKIFSRPDCCPEGKFLLLKKGDNIECFSQPDIIQKYPREYPKADEIFIQESECLKHFNKNIQFNTSSYNCQTFGVVEESQKGFFVRVRCVRELHEVHDIKHNNKVIDKSININRCCQMNYVYDRKQRSCTIQKPGDDYQMNYIRELSTEHFENSVFVKKSLKCVSPWPVEIKLENVAFADETIEVMFGLVKLTMNLKISSYMSIYCIDSWQGSKDKILLFVCGDKIPKIKENKVILCGEPQKFLVTPERARQFLDNSWLRVSNVEIPTATINNVLNAVNRKDEVGFSFKPPCPIGHEIQINQVGDFKPVDKPHCFYLEQYESQTIWKIYGFDCRSSNAVTIPNVAFKSFVTTKVPVYTKPPVTSKPYVTTTSQSTTTTNPSTTSEVPVYTEPPVTSKPHVTTTSHSTKTTNTFATEKPLTITKSDPGKTTGPQTTPASKIIKIFLVSGPRRPDAQLMNSLCIKYSWLIVMIDVLLLLVLIGIYIYFVQNQNIRFSMTPLKKCLYRNKIMPKFDT